MINRPVALQSVHLKTHPRDTLYCQLHSRVSWYNIFALPSAGSFCEMFHTLFAYRTPSSVTRGFLSFFLSLFPSLYIYISLFLISPSLHPGEQWSRDDRTKFLLYSIQQTFLERKLEFKFLWNPTENIRTGICQLETSDYQINEPLFSSNWGGDCN